MASTESFRNGLLAGLQLGTLSVPGLFLQSYARMGLTESEAMLLIHLMYFQSHDSTLFPTPEQLASRMSTSADRVLAGIERLVRDSFLTIEDVSTDTGIMGERYDMTPLFHKLAAAWEQEDADLLAMSSLLATAPPPAAKKPAPPRETAASRRKDLFTVFESEFARPLSPMEYETISNWLDQDQYSDSLILTALKEAVFAGKVHFRYIDRILMEWQRNRVTTPEDARSYTEKFRGG